MNDCVISKHSRKLGCGFTNFKFGDKLPGNIAIGIPSFDPSRDKSLENFFNKPNTHEYKFGDKLPENFVSRSVDPGYYEVGRAISGAIRRSNDDINTADTSMKRLGQSVRLKDKDTIARPAIPTSYTGSGLKKTRNCDKNLKQQKKETNKWIVHVKQHHLRYPHLSYKQALQAARNTYKTF